VRSTPLSRSCASSPSSRPSPWCTTDRYRLRNRDDRGRRAAGRGERRDRRHGAERAHQREGAVSPERPGRRAQRARPAHRLRSGGAAGSVPAGQAVTVDFKLTATPLSLNEVVVVGARTSRTAVETPVPVDVITAQEVIETGHTEVNQILATLAPSFNASQQTIADGSDHINPASLRGLGPDQVLVLVNGKRRHPPALVHVNGTFGRGTVGVDLNAIPTAAIERIEVLRDGASAQYGSDAIAGVINIVLKRQTERLEASSTVGTTPGGAAFGDITDKHDGDQVKADVNYGFPSAIGASSTSPRSTSTAAPPIARRRGGRHLPGVTGTAPTDSALAARGLTRKDFTMDVGQAAADVWDGVLQHGWCR